MRANPDSNPMRPMMPTGVPMRDFGPIKVIDWNAVQNPVQRAEFGLPAQMPAEQPEPDGGFRIPVLEDETLDRWFSDAAGNIQEAVADYFRRQKAIDTSRREANLAFEQAAANAGYQLATAAARETPGAFKRAVRAFGRVLRDEFGIPLPSGQTLDRVWEDVVVPVATNAQTVYRQMEKRSAGGLPQRYIRQALGVAGGLFGSGDAEPGAVVAGEQMTPEQVSAEQMAMVAPTMTEMRNLRRKLAAAGFRPENIDRDAMLYQEFMRNVRTFQNIEARALGRDVTFTSMPLGLEPFVRQQTDTMGRPTGVYQLESRYYDPVAATLMQLGRPGAYTQEEVQARLAADPSLLEASRQMANRSGQYLTPDTIIEANEIMPTLGRMGLSELHNLKQHMFKHGYYGTNDPDAMGQLHFRDINQQTIDAYTRMVRLAQENGYTWQGWEEKIAAEGGWFGSAPKEPAAPLIRLTSKDDLRSIANRVAQQTIGYQLSEPELEQFVASYQGMERSSQLRASGGGTVELPPDPGVAAQEMIRGGERKAEADAFAVGNTIDVLRQIMTGGGR